MNHRDYVAKRERESSGFQAAREELRPQYEFRRVLIGARIAAGLTQAELAERMGSTQSAVSRLESGMQVPTLDTLCRLASILGVDFTITPEVPISARPHRAA